MCKDRNIKVGIKKLDFSKIKGKFLAYLTDGREITIPISFFPDIKKMSVGIDTNMNIFMNASYPIFKVFTNLIKTFDFAN